MTTGGSGQGQRYLRSIRRTLGLLEDLLRELEAQAPELRPADSRSELLEQIHVAGVIEQRRLFELLDQRGLSHTWIGAQVASEYLDLWQSADGRTFYRVTPRAVRECTWANWPPPQPSPTFPNQDSPKTGTAKRTPPMTAYEAGDVVLVPSPSNSAREGVSARLSSSGERTTTRRPGSSSSPR